MVQSKTIIMITEKEIEKCPFCNGDSILVLRGNEHTKKRSAEIECTNCHVKLVVGAIRNSLDWCAEKVCEKWNKRVQNKVSDISDEDILGLENSFPLKDVLQNLVNASEYLLSNKNYDRHDYEEIEICIKRAKEIIQKLNVVIIVNESKDSAGSDAIEFAEWCDKYRWEIETRDEKNYTTIDFYEMFKSESQPKQKED